ncbi:hypothetical protein [Salipiger mangrovisoli]|uniref:Uncharacterized protein n=1 Tax=Salipiger mangrovisoli TaxID=2865933 RepID=A0ABR9X0P8_9RHOB|nr:hypothetical protein [Salipiger mangrovisoli]MBE9637118.1 hypothetical protein [Salipiger mangrovisoli]
MNAEKLAYFFEAAELQTVFADWPDEIGLALCLDEAGSCEMVLHHVEEGRAVLRKVGAVLDSAKGGFAVVPPVEGYPTRRVLFSDEQKLLKLVAGEDDLAEMAEDYLINYRFEQDRKARPAPMRVMEAMPEAVATALRGPEPFRWRPRLHLSELTPKSVARRKSKRGEMPEGYASAEVVSDSDCLFVEAEVSLGYRGVRVTLSPELVTIQTRAVLVDEVGFRDDFSRFVLPRKAVQGWVPGAPLVIDIPETRFPAGLRQRFAASPRTAEVTVTDHGVFVAPGAVSRAAEPAVPEAQPQAEVLARPRRARRLFTPVRVALAVLTGAGLMTGTMMRAVELPTGLATPVLEIAFDAAERTGR